MKVCMLIFSYWPGRQGGAERQCRMLSHVLSRRGIDVTVVTRWPGAGFLRREMDGKVSVVRVGHIRPAQVLGWMSRMVSTMLHRRPGQAMAVPWASRSRRPSLWASILRTDLEEVLFARAVRHFIGWQRDPFDILHVHESLWLAGLGVEVGRSLGIPVLVKESSCPVLCPMPQHTRSLWRYDALRRQASYLALTPEIATQLVEHGVPQEGIFMVPNGVEMPPEPASPAENSLVLCVANLRQGDLTKGFSALLTAWKSVHARQPSAALAIVGDGDSAPLREYATDLGVGDSVSFPGACEDVSAWYRKAAVFVLASRREGMSNALLEAQSWGLPAVVSDIPGNRAVVQDGVNGIVFPVDDTLQMAEGIARLLNSAELRQTQGAAGRRRMEAEFAAPVVAERLVNAYLRNLEMKNRIQAR